MKVLYFNLFLCKNGEKTDYPIYKLIDFISDGNPAQRTKIIESGKVIFSARHRFPVVGNNRNQYRAGHEFISNNRTAWIGKFNDNKPYTGAIGSDNIEQIIGELYQPNVSLFVSDYFLLLMEYNFLGPSKSQIEDFLSSFICSNDEDNIFKVQLFEVPKERMLALIPASESIKTVTITLKNEGFNLSNLFPNMGSREELLTKLFNGPVSVSEEMDVNQTTIVLKKGRKSREMKIDQIGEILSLINANDDNLVSAVIEFIDPRTREKVKIDLKHDGFHTTNKPTGEFTGFEMLADLLTQHYYDERNRDKDTSYSQYTSEIQNIAENQFTLIYPEDVEPVERNI